jgi:hypothetical protein
VTVERWVAGLAESCQEAEGVKRGQLNLLQGLERWTVFGSHWKIRVVSASNHCPSLVRGGIQRELYAIAILRSIAHGEETWRVG